MLRRPSLDRVADHRRRWQIWLEVRRLERAFARQPLSATMDALGGDRQTLAGLVAATPSALHRHRAGVRWLRLLAVAAALGDDTEALLHWARRQRLPLRPADRRYLVIRYLHDRELLRRTVEAGLACLPVIDGRASFQGG